MPIAKDPVEVLQVKKLLHCVRTEDYNQINKLCEKGVEHLVNYNEPYEGQTALILAAILNNEKMLEFLLECGAHPNIVDFKGRTALMRAAELGHAQALEILKKVKADATLTDLDGKDVLFYCLSAPTNRHDKCMKIVLTMGAGVNNKTKDGTPILVEACKKAQEYKSMCLMLLEEGCTPGSLDEKTQRSALHYAAACGSLEVCRLILKKGGNPNCLDRKKSTPAHEAAAGGHFEILVLLSAYGAHFDSYDAKGNNPIHLAAMCNSGKSCRFLSTRGCNPKVKNLEGDTPKSIAKDKKAKDASKNIRKGEKQYNKLSKQTTESGGINWSIRLYDYMYEHQERVKMLFGLHDQDQIGKVTREKFTEVISDEGFQSLVESSEEMEKLIKSHEKAKDQIDYELFLTGKKYINKQFLISSFEGKKKKKKKKGKGKKGKTKIVMPICILDEGPRMDDGAPPAIYQPAHVHFTDITRFHAEKAPTHPLQDDSAWYLKSPEKSFMNINHAARNGDLHTLLDAFKRGLPVDIRDKYYKTPLMVAASRGDLHTCQFLLSCNADVNAYDNFKWTALHHASHAGQLDVVKLLVESGADLNALTLTQATPFMRAVESASYPVVEYLLQKGAKISQENIKGKTAYDLAKEFADPRVYFTVKNKFDSLPQPKDGKKKGEKPKKKPADKKKKKAADVNFNNFFFYF
jgi:ankyrin repeat protein